MKRRKFVVLLTVCTFFVFSGIFLFSGCSESETTLDKGIKGPQVIVNPGTIHLSVAKLSGTKIIFNGSGFKPDESILVEILNIPIDDKTADLAIANAQIGKDGTFTAEVGNITKISEFMRAKIDVIKGVVVITGPPMPEGTYDVRVSSLMSDNKAQCTLKVEGPSLIDSFKDWLGVKLGKIVKE